jgi:hypothetical protein
MNAEEGESNVNFAGQNCDPLDKIMISPLASKVNVPTLLTAPFHRDCFMVEAAFAARHACALHCHKQNVMPACHVPVRWITSSLLPKIANE